MPAAVLLPTAIVILDEPEPGAAIRLGLKPTVVPDGTPLADRLMALLKPPLTVVVMVDLLLLPRARLTEAGAALIVKSFAGSVTITPAKPLTPAKLALMVVLPVAMPVLNPALRIDATEELVAVHVTELLRSRRLPSQ